MAIRVYSAAIGKFVLQNTSPAEAWEKLTTMFNNPTSPSLALGRRPIRRIGSQDSPPKVGDVFKKDASIDGCFVQLVEFNVSSNFAFTETKTSVPGHSPDKSAALREIYSAKIKNRTDVSFEQQGQHVLISIWRRYKGRVFIWNREVDAAANSLRNDMDWLGKEEEFKDVSISVERDDSLRKSFD